MAVRCLGDAGASAGNMYVVGVLSACIRSDALYAANFKRFVIFLPFFVVKRTEVLVNRPYCVRTSSTKLIHECQRAH